MNTEHTFGGHSMDRFLIDHETDVSGAGDLGGVGEMAAVAAITPTAEPVVAAQEPAAAAEPVVPDVPAWSPDDPRFQEAVDLRAAEIARGEISQLFTQFEQQKPQFEGDPVDPYEFLDPSSDQFGGNLLQLLAQRDQFMLGQMQQLFQPVQQRYQNESIAEGQQRIQDVIADDFAKNGEVTLPADAPVKVGEVIKDMASLYLPEMENRFGQNTARAAEQAITKATGVVRQLVAAAEQAGAAKNANHLATLTGARVEPGTAAAAISAGPQGGDEMSVARFHSTRTVAA